MSAQTRRLLLIACSQRKAATPGLAPAVQRYTGPSFQVLRKALRDGASAPTIIVLSAKYGLIPATYPIPSYDRRMDAAARAELQPVLREQWQVLVAPLLGDVTHCHLALGREYRRALDDIGATFAGMELSVAHGGIGEQLRQLKAWLYAVPKE